MQRHLEKYILDDLKKKMVFLSGPRQVGKTTLATQLLGGDENHPAYFNWDHTEDQGKLLNYQLPTDERLIVLDEIHKYSRWRNWLKGLYDKTKSKHKYLVTGSARLDLYKRGGDALTGRYHAFRLHPYALSEVDTHCAPGSVEALVTFGGFPEPWHAQSERSLRRWQKDRRDQVLRDDLRDLERVHDVALINLLVERIPDLIGSPLSINALREDLRVSHVTVQRWLTILERLFVVFRISPYGAPKIRAVQKEQKIYLWDWSENQNVGARFENFVASQLLNYCDFIEDTQGHTMELRYLRDVDQREVDFVVLKNRQPLFAVECKLSKTQCSPHVLYFAQRTKIPKIYQVHLGEEDYEHTEFAVRVMPFGIFARDVLK
jgi:predicted AAA+ superfamily ATPase